MKQRTKGFRTLLALTLALAMLLGNALPSLAEGDKLWIYDGSIDPDSTLTPDGSYEDGYTLDGDVDGFVFVSDGTNDKTATSLTVDGSVTSEYEAVMVDSFHGGTAEATVTGDVTTTYDGDEKVVSVTSYDDGSSSTATVGGTATGIVYVAAGENIVGSNGDESAGSGPQSTATVENGVNGGIVMKAYDGGIASLTVEGGVKGEEGSGYSDEGLITIHNGGYNQYIGDQPGGTVNLDITGGITAGEPALESMTVNPSEDPDDTSSAVTNIAITGNVQVETDGNTASGFMMETVGQGAETNLTLDGSLTTENSDGTAIGMLAYTMLGGETKATITGEIASTGGEEEGMGAGVIVMNVAGTTEIMIQDNVSVSGSGEDDLGIMVMNAGIYKADMPTSDTELITFEEGEEPRMTGNYVTFGDSIGRTMPLYVLEDGDEVKYYTGYNGDFYPLENVEPLQQGTAAVTVEGDVTSTGYGVAIYGGDDQAADIVIDGTVKGDEAGLVLLNDTELGKGVTLTVWAVEPNDGVIVYSADIGGMPIDILGSDGEEEGPELTQNKAAEAELQYIIRVKADQKDIIAAAGDAFDYRGYKVAHENDTVTLKLNIPEGYEVVEAYSDQAQSMKLEKNEKGEYFLTVPRGGAVELSVKLNKLPDPEPDPEPEPEPDEPDTVTITYVLDNDTKYDHIRVPSAVGESITLQGPPEREGYTFLYWQGTDVDINSPYYKAPDPDSDFQFRPGASYTAKKDYNFVAVWKKN